jgi:hypothetical protein
MAKPFRLISRSLLASIVMAALTLVAPQRAKADPMREFIMSCSYGVLAGTLVGAATLAFSDKPGDNLNKVARGASIGLYAGILLGLYVVYGVPGEDEDVVMQNLDASDFSRVRRVASGEKAHGNANANVDSNARSFAANVALVPLVGEKGIEGGAVFARVFSF